MDCQTSPSHITTSGLDCGYELCTVSDPFVSLTDERFACYERVCYRPRDQILCQKNLYVNLHCERIVYKVSFAEGGKITTRMIQ
ncbi:E4 ORF6/7 [Skunk adenovirus HUN/2009]|nr:E4 ORF6/7 [Skunk adenovirus HUN/2009]UWY10662.1 E4 ORF6/7 [Skunk adenovirus 1]